MARTISGHPRVDLPHSRLGKLLDALCDQIERAKNEAWLNDFATSDEQLSSAVISFQEELSKLGFGQEIERRAFVHKTMSGEGTEFANAVLSLDSEGLSEWRQTLGLGTNSTTIRDLFKAEQATKALTRELSQNASNLICQQRQVLACLRQELKLILDEAEELYSDECSELYMILAPVESGWSVQLIFDDDAFSRMKKAAVEVTEFVIRNHPSAEKNGDFTSVAAKTIRKQRGHRITTQHATFNSRMIDKVQTSPESHDWSARNWADFLVCSVSTVHSQPMWRELMKQRELTKLARQMKSHPSKADTRVNRKPKRSD